MERNHIFQFNFQWVKVFCLAGLVVMAGCSFSCSNSDRQPAEEQSEVINAALNKSEEHQSRNIDSLELILATHPPTGVELLKIYDELSTYYTHNYSPEKNRKYALKGIELARQLHKPYETALLYDNLGSAYDDLSKYDSAMVYYEVVFNLIKDIENKKQESEQNIGFLKGITYSNIGNLYNVQGFSDKAVEHYLKAIILFEKFNITDRLAKVFRNISLVYINMKNYEQAEYYLNKCMEINKKLQDSLGLASTLTRLSHVYLNQFKYPEALQCAEKADSIYTKHVEKKDLKIYNLHVLCLIWHNGFKNEQKAMEYALKALEESKQMGIKLEISQSLQLLASLYLEYKNYYKAEQIATEALQTDSSDLTNNILLYECLTKSYTGLGDVTKAETFFNLYKTATTAYSNRNFQSSLSEMEVKYETEKKEFRITDLEKEKRLMIGLSIAGGALLLLALATFILLWRWMVQKKRVAEKQQQLAEQQIKQMEQEKQLVATQAVLDGETRERARIARDLHDGLGSMLTGVKLKLLEMKKGATVEYADVERYDKAMGLLDESVKEMRRVAHHLMPDSLSRFGLKTALSDFCGNYPTTGFSYYGDESRLDPRLEVMIYRSIHELVNNALKYAGASRILVQIMQEPDRIAFTVQDDGCGFDPSAETKGTGLRNIRNRIASFGGDIQIDSKAGEGTEINGELRIRN